MKKIISIVISVVMLTLFSASAFAAFPDVAEDNPYKDAISALTSLKVINGYDDGSFRPDGNITRAEFAKIVVATMGYLDLQTESDRFPDTASHWAKQHINLCADLGIINGFEDGSFRPDEQVTLEQALKMVVCMLGYDMSAKEKGGYPIGYRTEATSLGLMDKVKDSQFTLPAKRGVIAQVINNSLEVKISEETASGVITVTQKTLLNDYLKVKKLKGTLVGVGDYVTKDSTIALGRNEMNVMSNSGDEFVIDYTTYTSDVTQINKYLGKTITVYYSQLRDNDERTLISIDDNTTKNTVTEILSKDIEGFENNQIKYYYDSSNKTRTLKLNFDNISVRYNGKLISDGEYIDLKGETSSTTVSDLKRAVSEWLNPDGEYFIYGNVILTDNGADGDINLIEIMDYETIAAYKAPTTDYRIQDKLKTANYLILDPNSPNRDFTILRDGTRINTTDIKANEVVLYAKSLDDELYTVYVTSKTVTGKITSMNSNTDTVELDGKEYSIADSCANYISTNENKTLKVGASGTFYLDMFDTIVYGTLNAEASLPYAYIYNAGVERASDEGYITAYIPTSNASSATTYTMANKVKVNGSSMKPEQVVSVLNAAAVNSNADSNMAETIYGQGKKAVLSSASQLAKIKVDGGKVTEIITLSDPVTDADGNVTENISNENQSSLVKYRSLEKCYYSSSSFKQSSSSNTYFSTNSSTVVLCIPRDRSESNSYAKKTVSSAFTSGDSYFVEAYDVNSAKVAGLIVLYGSNSKLTNVTKTTDFSVVASAVKETYDEANDETKQSVSVYRGAVSTPSSWTTFDKTEFNDIVPGDVIQFAYDSDNYIQGRINNIKFEDIKAVLESSNEIVENGGNADTIFDWTEEQEPSEENNKQSFLFDYRFKKAGTSEDETYTSTTLGTIPYSRAFVANVSQVITEGSKLYVTKSGFKQNADGDWVLDDSDYEEISTSSAKIIRMESNRKGFSQYVEDTTTPLSYTDIKDAKNYGTDCSKVLICTRAGSTKLIVIYN